MLSLNCVNSNGLLFAQLGHNWGTIGAQLGLNWGSIGVVLIGSAGFRWIHWFGFSVCPTPTGWNPSVGVMLFTTAVLPNKMSVSCPLQCIMFVFHLLLLNATDRPWELQSSKWMVPPTTCFWDSCLLWNAPCWADFFLFFWGRFGVCRCSGGFGELAGEISYVLGVDTRCKGQKG